MNVPEHLWRIPTRSAIESIATRFELPVSPAQQDWAWEVADPGRIGEFIEGYRSTSLNDDERFVLMEVLLQSFESSDVELSADPRWHALVAELERNVAIHAHSICYWACLAEVDTEAHWRVTPFMRTLVERLKAQLALGSVAT